MIMLRLLAQLIDLFTGFAALVVSFLTVPLVLSRFTENPIIHGVAVIIVFISLAVGLQYPFMRTGQSVGKAFFGLKVISTASERPLTLSILLQREIFLKLLTCYFICFPILFGQPGGHEIASQTEVIKKHEI